MFGDLFALPFRVANAPLRAVENLVAKASGEDEPDDDERMLSMPLDIAGDAVKEAFDGRKKP